MPLAPGGRFGGKFGGTTGTGLVIGKNCSWHLFQTHSNGNAVGVGFMLWNSKPVHSGMFKAPSAGCSYTIYRLG
jgi:hypothetical protein